MSLSILKSIGLTDDQIETYNLLLESGSLNPTELAKKSGQKRTNAYMSLKKLEERGLATRDEDSKRLTYRPLSPAKLEQLIEVREKELSLTKSKLQESLPDLLTTYYKNTDKPGIQFYEGEDGLYKVYQDHLDTGEPVYFVRTPADQDFFGKRLYEYMEERAQKGITAHGLAPYSKEREEYSKKNDKQLKRVMVYCDPKSYTAPVEISIYGNKTAFISFGEELLATIVDSPQIATAMRELFTLAQSGSIKN